MHAHLGSGLRRNDGITDFAMTALTRTTLALVAIFNTQAHAAS